MLPICCNSSLKLRIDPKKTQRIIKIKPFIAKYNWKGINWLSEKDDWNILLLMF